MKKIFPMIILAFLVFFARSVHAEYYFENPEKFKKYNPDVQKYQFVADYITSLHYLYLDEKTSQRLDVNLDDRSSVKEMMDQLAKSDMNLRIAKHFLKKYLASENKFIKKATDELIDLCEQQVGLNKKEYESLESFYNLPEVTEDKRKEFLAAEQSLSALRKESLKNLLGNTLLVTKILISSTPDQYGDLTKLAISSDQRSLLLQRLKLEFLGEQYEGDIREGQTFLQASVVTLRSMLEDKDWVALGSL